MESVKGQREHAVKECLYCMHYIIFPMIIIANASICQFHLDADATKLETPPDNDEDAPVAEEEYLRSHLITLLKYVCHKLITMYLTILFSYMNSSVGSDCSEPVLRPILWRSS